jgi:hypothetical protein
MHCGCGLAALPARCKRPLDALTGARVHVEQPLARAFGGLLVAALPTAFPCLTLLIRMGANRKKFLSQIYFV